jgi:predicted NBD/HSP70 family sugar kinase
MPSLEVSRKSNRKRTAGASLSGANLERVGDHNQRVILQAIRVNGPITRVTLAQISGLTPPAVANITKRLLDDGLILEAGRVQGARGQPAMNLTINPDGCLSIGVNIDRDHITVVMLDLLGAVRARASQEIEFPLPADVAKFCKAQIRKMLAAWKGEPPRLSGIGVALPDDLGRVDLPHRPENYDVWSTADIGKLMADILPLPVFLENDAAAAALGELQFGHGLRRPSFFYVLVSSGLGGGLVVEGDYFRGAQGRSGEIGFLPVSSPKTQARSLQEVVSLSALYAHLEAGGIAVSPDQLTDLSPQGQALVEGWIALRPAAGPAVRGDQLRGQSGSHLCGRSAARPPCSIAWSRRSTPAWPRSRTCRPWPRSSGPPPRPTDRPWARPCCPSWPNCCRPAPP